MSDASQPICSILEIDSLTVRYKNSDSVPVLSNVSLKIVAGELLAIIGQSGCGKSTLLHTVAGFIKPDSGRVMLNGRPHTEPSIQIGFISQRCSLFPWLTVEDNIAFGLRSQRTPEDQIQNTVNSLLKIVQLDDRRHYYPDQLSGGMQQRVALARSVAPEPAVLLLDEPFSALDSEIRKRMQDLLLQLWDQHRTTMVFVTHDIDEATTIADRILVLSQFDAPRAVKVPFSRPRSPSLFRTQPAYTFLDSISTQTPTSINHPRS